ncbi:MAG: SpoIIE family protein phosphatase [Deltaproteobacteria bacterium]|nr:SpoIIE family protein phosphatase [Deltaproteobacteria bacterium]
MRLRAELIEALEKVNRRILRSRGGTTALVAIVVNDRLQMLNVGDSQALLVGQQGKVKYMTTAQSPIGYAVEAGVLEYDDALLHPARHVISNAVGTQSMSIEIGPWLRVTRRDTLLMGSDGLFDNLYGMELVDLSRRGSLQQAAGRLRVLAGERMDGAKNAQQPSKPDDLTFLLFRRGASARGKSSVKASAEKA